jgi:rod shape-determining protein MreD
MRRVLAIFLCQLVLWSVVSQANHLLTGLHVYLFAGGLYVAFAALTLSGGECLAAAMLAGAACDAAEPVPFGTHALLFAAAGTLIFSVRDRLQGDDGASRIAVVLVANLALFLGLSLCEAARARAAMGDWPRLVSDLLCSQVFLALATPWFFALQRRAVALGDWIAQP